MLACMVSVFDKIRLETVLISRRRNSIVTEGENTVIQWKIENKQHEARK